MSVVEALMPVYPVQHMQDDCEFSLHLKFPGIETTAEMTTQI